MTRSSLNAYHILRPGGKLIIVSSNQLYFRIGKTLGPLLKLARGDINQHTYHPRQIVQMLKRTGFVNIKRRGFGVIPFRGFGFLDEIFSERYAVGQLISGIRA